MVAGPGAACSPSRPVPACFLSSRPGRRQTGPGVRRAEGPQGEGADCKLKGGWKCWKKAFRILPQINSLFRITCNTQTSGPLVDWAGTSRTLPGHHIHEQSGVRNTSVPTAQLWSTPRGDGRGPGDIMAVAQLQCPQWHLGRDENKSDTPGPVLLSLISTETKT